MKTFLIVIFTILSISFSYSQNKEQTNILNKFINAHNIGSQDAISEFIKDTYHPDIYAKINLKDYVAFYNQIVNEFGPLNFMIYKKVEETPLKFVVHLIKKDEHIKNQDINPLEILAVEIDLSKKNPIYIERGLGLGSLVCEQRKQDH